MTQVGLYGFETSLAYKASSWTARAVHTEKPFLEKKQKM